MSQRIVKVKPITEKIFNNINGKVFTSYGKYHTVIQIHSKTPNCVRCRNLITRCLDLSDSEKKGYFEYVIVPSEEKKSNDDKYFLIIRKGKYYLQDFISGKTYNEIDPNFIFKVDHK